MTQTIQIVQGLSAAGSFRQAMHPRPGGLLVNEDVLSCGPLPPFRSIDEWTQLREAYWDSVAVADDERPFNHDVLGNARVLRDVESVVLWLGIGAAEQLLLAWIVQLLKLVESGAQVHAVQFAGTGETNPQVLALGLMNPDQIKHHPPVQQLSPEAILELDRIWDS